MARKSFIQILEEKYDINREFERITTLFTSGLVLRKFRDYTKIRTETHTLEEMISKVFYQWSGRGTCICYQDLRTELGINEIVHKKSRSADEILLCLEYYFNIERLFINKILPTLNQHGYEFDIQNYTIMCTNFNKLLDYLHQQIIPGDNDVFFIIPKDPAATAVAEITSSKDVVFSILKYHHASLKGQVEEKRKLLLSIANEYELLLKKPIDGFTDYFIKTRNMLNNLNIRHNNTAKNEFLTQMNDEELEGWYDELYQLLLFCVLIKDNKERKDKVDGLLKRINAKPEKH